MAGGCHGKVKIFLFFALASRFLFSAPAWADTPNFQFSPPPIPWYEFSRGDRDLLAGATFLYLNGEIDEPDQPSMSGSVDVYGLGGNAFWRHAFGDQFAFVFSVKYHVPKRPREDTVSETDSKPGGGTE